MLEELPVRGRSEKSAPRCVTELPEHLREHLHATFEHGGGLGLDVLQAVFELHRLACNPCTSDCSAAMDFEQRVLEYFRTVRQGKLAPEPSEPELVEHFGDDAGLVAEMWPGVGPLSVVAMLEDDEGLAASVTMAGAPELGLAGQSERGAAGTDAVRESAQVVPEGGDLPAETPRILPPPAPLDPGTTPPVPAGPGFAQMDPRTEATWKNFALLLWVVAPPRAVEAATHSKSGCSSGRSCLAR